MNHAVVVVATNEVREVLNADPGTVEDCRVVATDHVFVPSVLTHVWIESGGQFALGQARTDPERIHHFSRAAQLLGTLGYQGALEMDDIETWLISTVNAAVSVDDLKALIGPGMAALGHLSIAVSRGWIKDPE